MVFSTLLAIQHFNRRIDGWNVGEGSDLQGNLRLVGRAAARGSRHPCSGLLLGLHEGQPAPAELHIKPHHHQHLSIICRISLSKPPGRKKVGFNEEKRNKTRYLFKSLLQKETVLLLLSLSLLVQRVSKTGWWRLRLLYISIGNYDDAYSLMYCLSVLISWPVWGSF